MPNAAVITIASDDVDARPDPVGAPIRQLLELFSDALSEVRFPDLDAEILGAAVTDVEEGAEDVTRLEAELSAAKAALEERHDALLAKAQRGLAYARIFADGQADLLSQVEAVTLPNKRAAKAAVAAAVAEPPKRRGRKAAVAAESLFVASDSTPPTAVDVGRADAGDGTNKSATKSADKNADKNADDDSSVDADSEDMRAAQ